MNAQSIEILIKALCADIAASLSRPSMLRSDMEEAAGHWLSRIRDIERMIASAEQGLLLQKMVLTSNGGRTTGERYRMRQSVADRQQSLSSVQKSLSNANSLILDAMRGPPKAIAAKDDVLELVEEIQAFGKSLDSAEALVKKITGLTPHEVSADTRTAIIHRSEPIAHRPAAADGLQVLSLLIVLFRLWVLERKRYAAGQERKPPKGSAE